MALTAPKSIEVENIQFKLRTKFPIFKNPSLRNNINLIAVSQSVGLAFVGDPNLPEFKVLPLKKIYCGADIAARQIPLPNVPNNLAVSCDGSLLAVSYTQNGLAFVALYNIQSFTSATIQCLLNIRISSEENLEALQILWNPVMSNIFAIVLNNGSLGMYILNENKNSYEFQTINKTEQVRCACWSPKGKQIVVGFPNGKICQYKPDLKQARAISCNIQPGPFDIIALQWLSTYQFAAVFLQPDGSPNLYIINAPKIGAPSFINYFDICYSGNGPRSQQVTLMHIQPWNLLMMSSSNSQEIGLLGTKETGESPFWNIYLLEGESRIEIPLNEQKEDGYPIGFTLDVGTSHQVIIAEKELPVMPMVHVLSTYGLFLSYDFLNLTPSAPGICSPSPPPADTSGLNQFKLIEEILGIKNPKAATDAPVVTEPKLSTEFNFIPFDASTPATKDKQKPPMFSAFSQPFTLDAAVSARTNTTPSIFEQQPPTNFSFISGLLGQPVSNQLTFGMNGKTTLPSESQKIFETVSVESSKPLHKVPPVYTPPQLGMSAGETPSIKQESANQAHSKNLEQSLEMREIGKQIISKLLNSFGSELQKFLSKPISDVENQSIQDILKSLNERLVALNEIHDRANEKDFDIDMQNLRHSLKETHTMLIETQTKMEMFKNPELVKISVTPNELQINRRYLSKFRNEINKIEAQLSLIQKRIDSQWSNYQDIVKSNSETQIRVPSLDRIYQSLTKEKDILENTRQRLRLFKTKVKPKVSSNSPMDILKKASQDSKIDSITESMLHVSFVPTCNENKLTEEKTVALFNILDDRKERSFIRPQRPNRVGLNSEVILETKTKLRKEREACSLIKMEQQRIEDQTPLISKPTATKPVRSPTTTPNVPAGLNTKLKAAGDSSNKIVESEKTKPFGNITAKSTNVVPTTLSFAKKTEISNAITSTITTTPISFSAQVFKGDPKPITPSFGLPKPIIFSSVPGNDVANKENETKKGSNLSAPSFGQTLPALENSNFTTASEKSAFQFKPSGSLKFPFTGTSISGSVQAPSKAALPTVDSGTQPKSNPSDHSNIFSGFAMSTKTTNVNSPASSFNFASFGATTTTTPSLFATKAIVCTASSTTSNNLPNTSPLSTFSFASFGNASTTATSTISSLPSESSAKLGSGLFGATKTTNSSTVFSTTAKESSDAILNSLTICSPSNVGEGKSQTSSGLNPTPAFGGSIFSGISSSSNQKSIFGNSLPISSVTPATSIISTPPASPTSKTLSFVSPITTAPTITSVATVSPKLTASEAASTTVVTPAIETPTPQFALASIKTSPAPTTSAFGAVTSPVFGQTATSTTGSSGFSTTPFFSSTPATTSVGSIFGGTTGTSTTVTTSASIFGSASTVNLSSPFGAVSSSPFNTATSSNPISSGGSLFSGFGNQQAMTSASGSIFGNASSTFGNPPTSSSTTGQGLFGSVAPPTSTPSQGIFAAASASTSPPSSGIFAAASASTSPPSSGIFAAAAASTQPPVSGSAFGQNMFNQTGQTSGSIFGSTSSAPTGMGFSTGSMFGSPSTANTSGGQSSIFGGANQQQQPSNQSFGTFGDGSMFGQNSFASPSQTGSFAQGGPSIAQTGFGSPGSSFQKPVIGSNAPVFGSPAAFGSAPSFGGPPSFGGTATFGSPKGFGSFASIQTPAAFSSPPTQKNSLFESLGQSETGLSFGNLAQSGNENNNKPAFGGGSAFMNYRA